MLYHEWKELFPEGTREDYACDMAGLTAEVVDEVLQELPATFRLPERRVRNLFPDCDNT